MQQPDLFAPMQRRHDPPTSRIAAERVVANGTANAHRRIIAEAIRHHPGSTYREIADWTRWPSHTAADMAPAAWRAPGRREAQARCLADALTAAAVQP